MRLFAAATVVAASVPCRLRINKRNHLKCKWNHALRLVKDFRDDWRALSVMAKNLDRNQQEDFIGTQAGVECTVTRSNSRRKYTKRDAFTLDCKVYREVFYSDPVDDGLQRKCEPIHHKHQSVSCRRDTYKLGTNKKKWSKRTTCSFDKLRMAQQDNSFKHRYASIWLATPCIPEPAAAQQTYNPELCFNPVQSVNDGQQCGTGQKQELWRYVKCEMPACKPKTGRSCNLTSLAFAKHGAQPTCQVVASRPSTPAPGARCLDGIWYVQEGHQKRMAVIGNDICKPGCSLNKCDINDTCLTIPFGQYATCPDQSSTGWRCGDYLDGIEIKSAWFRGDQMMKITHGKDASIHQKTMEGCAVLKDDRYTAFGDE